MRTNTTSSKSYTNLIIGIHPLEEALDAGKNIDKVLFNKELRSDKLRQLKDRLKKERIPFVLVPEIKLNKITRSNHQGVLAFIAPIAFADFENVVMSEVESGEPPLFLLLDRVTDVRNFGAICRSAECFGVKGIIVPDVGAAQINEDALKASAGALMHLNICKVKNLLDALDYLHASGIGSVVLSEKAAVSLQEFQKSRDQNLGLCIIMGSEEDGINPQLMKRAHQLVTIPMKGKTNSLNVSVATGIALASLSN
ncbi:MAG: 23S rRNA (guanosine(2251)-2'-O)-methyltransferase RlmB [Flavobacteriales bacterium]|nr:23S rRNA (guanosine(2251)-2'-O)-methyltransferase RlmB [Flavobacteriales bacterium]MDP4731536.1 23S rRNA (guanosine(2251)-2'-O)-methyltransferase RlmB [Flavobacteriales bacterium]MDP4818137.1 23S rRNA (guanosine(2251)-2'-O)-methyltransferase RlmB [Flavobacteriales bacterium]MDP4951090.1 23S rRNA (guanosine(2251)-2'-O)-methyltransferase RlmB [Flavobacteriales bacterium]